MQSHANDGIHVDAGDDTSAPEARKRGENRGDDLILVGGTVCEVVLHRHNQMRQAQSKAAHVTGTHLLRTVG